MILLKIIDGIYYGLNKARPTKYISKKPDGKGGWIYKYKKDTKKKEKMEKEKGESHKSIDYDNEKILKEHVEITEHKNWNTKKIVSKKGIVVTYGKQPKKIEFKNKMINETNQNIAAGYVLSDVRIDNKKILDRVLNGQKPMGHLGFFKKENMHKFMKENFKQIDKNKFHILVRYYEKGGKNGFIESEINIARKGKMGDLFDLDTLEKDYVNAGIEIDVDAVKDDEIDFYFTSVYSPDYDSKIVEGIEVVKNNSNLPHLSWDYEAEKWETGLILGLPIENTISLYKDAIRHK
jgi:hypothetical protein